jgi:hypothetical protein
MQYANSADIHDIYKDWYSVFEEKFAELIVRECMTTVSDCSVEYCTRPQIVSEIKEHFGVE